MYIYIYIQKTSYSHVYTYKNRYVYVYTQKNQLYRIVKDLQTKSFSEQTCVIFLIFFPYLAPGGSPQQQTEPPKSHLDIFETQCVAVCCSVLRCVAVRCGALQCVALRCSVLQCVAVCCSVLQCVAACCIVLHCQSLQNCI